MKHLLDKIELNARLRNGTPMRTRMSQCVELSTEVCERDVVLGVPYKVGIWLGYRGYLRYQRGIDEKQVAINLARKAIAHEIYEEVRDEVRKLFEVVAELRCSRDVPMHEQADTVQEVIEHIFKMTE